jgi:osmotically-inducible protein OsmY
MLGNLALNARVRAALKDNESTQKLSINIEASGDYVVLSGIVLNGQESEDAARVASQVSGVARLDNRLHLMSTAKRFPAARF